MSHPGSTAVPVVIRISPMAHVAVGFFALGAAHPDPGQSRLVRRAAGHPGRGVGAVFRYRTDGRSGHRHGAHAVEQQHGRPWEDVDGLALRPRRVGVGAPEGRLGELRLPAVTFATLPQLTAATDGRVPNPYE